MNRTVLITGATSGIGQAATGLFAAKGYTVFATYRDPADRDALAAIAGVRPIQLDLTDEAQIHRAVDEVESLLGDQGLYALINNAGITYAAPFEFARPERARQVIDVNLMAPFHLAQACIPLLRRHNELYPVKARVVNVASWAGMMSSPFLSFYNASKYGVIGLTESMYYDLGLLEIHAVLAVPGVTRTPLLAKTTADGTASLASLPPEGHARYRQYFEHFATMGERSNLAMLRTAEQVATSLVRIVETKRPRFSYKLSIDAKLVDGFVTRFLPFRLRARMNRSMYRLPRTATI